MESDLKIFSLFSQMGFAIFLRNENLNFQLVSEAPEWLKKIINDINFNDEVDYNKFSPFLENFLTMASRFWEEDSQCNISSDLWIETDEEENIFYLRAFAMKANGSNYLIIENINEKVIGNYSFIQKARNKSLEFENLKKTESKLKSNIDYNKQFFPIIFSEIDNIVNNINELNNNISDIKVSVKISEELDKLSQLKDNIVWFDEE